MGPSFPPPAVAVAPRLGLSTVCCRQILNGQLLAACRARPPLFHHAVRPAPSSCVLSRPTALGVAPFSSLSPLASPPRNGSADQCIHPPWSPWRRRILRLPTQMHPLRVSLRLPPPSPHRPPLVYLTTASPPHPTAAPLPPIPPPLPTPSCLRQTRTVDTPKYTTQRCTITTWPISFPSQLPVATRSCARRTETRVRCSILHAPLRSS